MAASAMQALPDTQALSLCLSNQGLFRRLDRMNLCDNDSLYFLEEVIGLYNIASWVLHYCSRFLKLHAFTFISAFFSRIAQP